MKRGRFNVGTATDCLPGFGRVEETDMEARILALVADMGEASCERLAIATGLSLRRVQEYVRLLVRDRRIVALGKWRRTQSGGHAPVYQLVEGEPTPVAPAPAPLKLVALPGDAPTSDMWTAMRRLRCFTPAALLTVVPSATTVDEIASYCRQIYRAGYLELLAAGQDEGEVCYRLMRDTGDRAPRVDLATCVRVRDENTGEYAVRLDDRHDA
jgi:hypothetical protein